MKKKKKRALLVVAGGRPAPDVLPLLYLQPQLVLTVTSQEGWLGEQAFLDIARALPSCEVHPPLNVDAYNLKKGEKACRDLCESYPDSEWEWIFTISSAPKILAIAAYEFAQEKKVPCLYVDTQHEKVVSLVRGIGKVDKQRFFHLPIDDYMGIQKRTCTEKKGPTDNYRAIVESWTDVAQEMALSGDTPTLTTIFYRHLKSKGIEESIKIPMQLSVDIAAFPLVQFLEQKGLLKRNPLNTNTYYFSSIPAAHFLGSGDWLEIYVWKKTLEAGFADDCRWGYIIKSQIDNELDLAVIYKAQLVIAECKTDLDPFKGQKSYLRDIAAIAELLGGKYVSKVFVTNQPGAGDSYEPFRKQAAERNIVIVTRENLSKVGEILKEQAINPKYPRR